MLKQLLLHRAKVHANQSAVAIWLSFSELSDARHCFSTVCHPQYSVFIRNLLFEIEHACIGEWFYLYADGLTSLMASAGNMDPIPHTSRLFVTEGLPDKLFCLCQMANNEGDKPSVDQC